VSDSILSDLAHALKSHNPLPLHVAVALANGGLENLWIDNDDPEAMVEILQRTHRALHPRLKIRALRIALKTVDAAQETLDQLESLLEIDPEAFQLWGSKAGATVLQLRDSLEERHIHWDHPSWKSSKIEFAQASVREALRSILAWRLRGGDPQVYDTMADALELGASPRELSRAIQWLHPVPPTLEEIVAVISEPQL